MILLKYVYNMRIYSVERTRGRCEDNHYHGEKYRQDATTFYTEKTFNSVDSSDKLQNVSQSVNVSSVETVCLTTVKC